MSRLEFSCNSMANNTSNDLMAIVALPPIQSVRLFQFPISLRENKLEDSYLQKCQEYHAEKRIINSSVKGCIAPIANCDYIHIHIRVSVGTPRTQSLDDWYGAQSNVEREFAELFQ